MAVARPEFQLDEVDALIELIPPVSRLRSSDPLRRARNELLRARARGREAEAGERRHMAELRARRHVPGDVPLTPQSMSRRIPTQED